MKVVAGVRGVLAASYNVAGHVSLIWSFVRREAYISVNPVGTVLRSEPSAAYVWVPTAYLLNQLPCEVIKDLLGIMVLIFVGFKPVPVVVQCQP